MSTVSYLRDDRGHPRIRLRSQMGLIAFATQLQCRLPAIKFFFGNQLDIASSLETGVFVDKTEVFALLECFRKCYHACRAHSCSECSGWCFCFRLYQWPCFWILCSVLHLRCFMHLFGGEVPAYASLPTLARLITGRSIVWWPMPHNLGHFTRKLGTVLLQ